MMKLQLQMGCKPQKTASGTCSNHVMKRRSFIQASLAGGMALAVPDFLARLAARPAPADVLPATGTPDVTVSYAGQALTIPVGHWHRRWNDISGSLFLWQKTLVPSNTAAHPPKRG